MILGFIAGILNKYIGAYFEDIDASQLTGSIFGGGVTLTNINLRSSIFESLGIPFHVVAGKCGKLEVKYSLTRLYSEPVVVTLKDLHLLVIPAQGVEYNDEAQQESRQAEKLRQLEIFESVKRHLVHSIQKKATKIKQKETEEKENNDRKDQDSLLHEIANSATNIIRQEATFFDMWVMQLLRNIQFKIESVHVRFEDDLTKPTEHFAVGLFLRNLEVLTTDANWQNQYIKDYLPDTSYKLASVDGLSVYWNSAPTTMFKGIGVKSTLFENLAKVPNRNSDRSFNKLFEPISTDLKVQVTPFPDVIQEPFSKPRCLIETSLAELSLNISDKQVKDFIPFLDSLDLMTKSYKFRKFRAEVHNLPYQANYKKWWKFAYNCILDDINRRRNNFRWSHILEHRKKCKKYLRAYYKKRMERPSSSNEQTITELERDLELFVLILLRQHVDIIVSRETQFQEPNPPAADQDYMTWVTSWFSSMVSWEYWFPPRSAALSEAAPPDTETPTAGTGTRLGNTNSPPKFPNFSVLELTPNDKEIIRVAVGFAKNIDIVNYPDDYVDLETNVLLNKFRARIYQRQGISGNPETVLDSLLESVSFAFRGRPVGDGLQVELKIGRVEVYGGDFPQEGTPDDIYSPPPLITTANPNACEYFLKFMYEMNPVGSDVNQKVSLEGLALQFTYLSDSVDRIIECFTIPPSVKNNDVRISGGSIPASKILGKIMQFRKSPTTKLLRLMESKGKVEINVCLIAPYVVIPQDSTTNGKTNFVVVNLGEINVVGTLVGGTLCENGTCSYFL